MKLEKNIILAPFTTYKIGGPADLFIRAENKQDLIEGIIYAKQNLIPYFILGKGANILFGDKGFRGLVIQNTAKDIKVTGQKITVDSGVTIEDIINTTKGLGLSGFEHFAGIPSTVGGAMWQNLHFLSPDRTETLFIESIVDSAEILDENCNLITVDRNFFKFSYDYSILHDNPLIVTEVIFNLKKLNKTEIENRIKNNLEWRAEKQPPLEKFPSCGSVFKKIENIGAGRLIDQSGLKGFKIGGAMVSPIHANFIVNTGNASAKNVLDLIYLVQKTVREKTGYNLETEIKLIGDF